MVYNDNEILTFNGDPYYPFAELSIILTKFHVTIDASQNFEIENVKCHGTLLRQKLMLLGFTEEFTELSLVIESGPKEQIERIRSHHETETHLNYPIGDDIYGHFRIKMRQNPYYKDGGEFMFGYGQLILEDSIFLKVLTLIKERNISAISIDATFNDLYLSRPNATFKNAMLLEANDFPSKEVYLVNNEEWPEQAYGESNGLITDLSINIFEKT